MHMKRYCLLKKPKVRRSRNSEHKSFDSETNSAAKKKFALFFLSFCIKITRLTGRTSHIITDTTTDLICNLKRAPYEMSFSVLKKIRLPACFRATWDELAFLVNATYHEGQSYSTRSYRHLDCTFSGRITCFNFTRRFLNARFFTGSYVQV